MPALFKPYPFGTTLSKYICLTLALSTNCFADSPRLEKINLQLKWQHSFQFAGYYAAIEKGFYKDEGLDVNLKELNFKKDFVKQVLAGESEYGTSDSSLLIYHLQGEPVVLVNQFFQHSPLIFISLRSSGIISPYEMIAKKVAYSLSNAGDAAPLSALLLKTIGGTSKIINAPFEPSHYQDLIDGKIDVVSAYLTSQPYQFQVQGIDINIINPQNYGIDFYGDNLFTNQEELTKHPERVKKMSLASIKGWQYALDHPVELIKPINSKYNPALSLGRLQYEANMTRQMIIPELLKLGSIDPNRYQQTAEDYVRLGLIDHGKINNNSFYALEDQIVGHDRNLIELTSEEQKWLAEHPHIRFTGDPNWLPYEGFDKKGHYRGIVAEYLKLIQAKLGISIDISPSQSWNQSLAKIKNGDVDIISETIDSDLSSELQFTQAYLSSPIVISMRDQAIYVDNIEQIKHLKLALVRDYGYNPPILRQYPDIHFYWVDSVEEGLTAVSTGKVDALIATLAQVSYQINAQNINNVRVVGKTEFQSQLGFGMSKEFSPLVPIFNKALNAISPKEKQTINDIWGNNQILEELDYSALIKAAIIFLGIMAYMLFWNWRMAKEITHRKQSEEKINLLNERFALATELAELGVWELDLSANFSFLFDDKSYQIFGLIRQDKMPFENWLSFVAIDDRTRVREAFESLKSTEVHQHIEFQFIRPDQKRLTIDCNASSLYINHKINKIIGVNKDVTARKLAVLELEKAMLQAEQANRAKSTFLANMSHEIRTPLNAIIGFTELLNEQINDPKLKSFAKTIQSAGQNLLALINDILDLSKIEAGKLRIEKKVCNPHHLFTELSHVFMLKMAEKKLDFILEIDPKIPEYLLLDDTRIRQILFNLIGNAVKFTEQGYVRLKARTDNEDEIHSKLDLLIDIEDTGVGIPPDQQKLIFAEFEQSEGQDNKKYGGTGLGLAISQRLIEMMGGRILVASQLGTGTTFTLQLLDVDVPSVFSENNISTPQAYTPAIEFLPSVILVVDDVSDNRDLLKESFKGTNLVVFEAENGLSAITLSKTEKIDLIIMDIRMPVMDGYQAAEQIKSFLDVPIIALTASVMRDDYERVKSANFDGYLRKPVLKAELVKELAKFLPHQYQSTELMALSKLSLNEEDANKLLEILPKLKHLSHKCEKIGRSNNISEMSEFTKELTTLAEFCPIPQIYDYATELDSHIDSFDILEIKKMLSDFPNLVLQFEYLSINRAS
ncbi:MAG: ABC transporter substrate-binding protein [Methylococcaceae bacterium]|jgi:two-component system sensor histidine kinase EvgS